MNPTIPFQYTLRRFIKRAAFFIHFELGFWIISLIVLYFSDPLQNHFTFCPLKIIGITWCPGCGFGHSVSFLLHGAITASIYAHPFGMMGLLIIIARIITLVRDRFLLSKQFN